MWKAVNEMKNANPNNKSGQLQLWKQYDLL